MSVRTENKFKILNTLKNSELCIEDISMYTDLDRLDIVPVLADLLRWNEVKTVDSVVHYLTKKKRKIYTTTEKGERKIQYLKERYGFTWKPKTVR